MKINLSKRIIILPLVAMLSSVMSINSHADEYYRPVTQQDALVLEECGACHMAYSSEMLPAASWQKIIANLDNHFGEDASISPESAAQLSAFFSENAADSGWFGNRFTRGIDQNRSPIRITETPYWIREHYEVNPANWQNPEIKSKSNCLACHRNAERGGYDDD